VTVTPENGPLTPQDGPGSYSESGRDHKSNGELRRAHAKLTLSLRITGVRADGFHLIDSEMVSLDLHDVLVFDRQRRGLIGTGPFADGMPLDNSNLVAQALQLANTTAGVAIQKNIPHGGGLGGGSSDAATVLKWAGYPTHALGLEGAAQLGADIAFCLIGGRAKVSGIGEIVEPLPHIEQIVTLIVPPLRVGTPEVYRAWDALGGPTATSPNDLEDAAISVQPLLRWWRDSIEDRTGNAPILAGSGATWFVHGKHQDALAELVDKGATVMQAHTVPSDIATNRTASAAR
jgi:4-diphosphocytidyl-2-C-methyl-D-erythritol kinase